MRPVEREASTFFVIMDCVVGKSHYELAGNKISSIISEKFET
jgi:hypothetical protein